MTRYVQYDERIFDPNGIKARREKLGWSAFRLAQESKVSYPTVVAYELGSRTTQISKVHAIEKALAEAEKKLTSDDA